MAGKYKLVNPAEDLRGLNPVAQYAVMIEEAGYYPIHISDNKLVAPHLRQKVGCERLEYLVKSIEQGTVYSKQTPPAPSPSRIFIRQRYTGRQMGTYLSFFCWMSVQPLLKARAD